MPTRTTIFATNDNVSANDLNSLAGAWNSYTPTLTGFTKGNGTTTGAYLQFGKLVIFRAQFVFGSTSAAASAAPALTLPVTANSAWTQSALFGAGLVDTGTAYYGALGLMTSTTAVSIYVIGTNGLTGLCSTTSPFTWATGDVVYVNGTYEAA